MLAYNLMKCICLSTHINVYSELWRRIYCTCISEETNYIEEEVSRGRGQCSALVDMAMNLFEFYKMRRI
jgi:hypothetical protein